LFEHPRQSTAEGSLKEKFPPLEPDITVVHIALEAKSRVLSTAELAVGDMTFKAENLQSAGMVCC
jgi:hypothetical protein